MRKKDEENRIRVARMLNREIRVDDLSRLLRSLRGRSFGIQTIKDLGDLTAHEDFRDNGLAVNAVTDVCFAVRLHAELTQKQLNLTRLPSFVPRVLKATFGAVADDVIKTNTGMNRKHAFQALNSLKKKLKPNDDGTLLLGELTDVEGALFNLLMNRLVVKAIYSDEEVFRDFCTVLQKNNLLCASELTRFAWVKSPLALFIISLMHRTEIILPDGTRGHFKAGFSGPNEGNVLCVGANTPLPNVGQNIFLGTDVFTTKLNALECCTKELLQESTRANGIDENPVTWDFTIELSPDFKLTKMCV